MGEEKAQKLKGYEGVMKQWLENVSEERQFAWAQKQCYIVLGNLLSACAVAQIDSCPMEGFTPSGYDEVLGLKEQGYTSTVVVPLGYRSSDDISVNRKKTTTTGRII